jgi:beta-mannosidase
MLQHSLNGSWKMRNAASDEWIEARVPGSVFHDLLQAGRIKDPYYRDNEEQSLSIAAADYEYEKEFEIGPEMLECDRVALCCEGLDALAEIWINGVPVAKTANMHRRYEFEIKPLLRRGANRIQIRFLSPLRYIAEKQREHPSWGTPDAIEGFQHLRKAHFMFGWDWGPRIPDCGIWRDISLKGYHLGRLQEVYPTQRHRRDGVQLDLRVKSERWSPEPLIVEANVYTPDGVKLSQSVTGRESLNQLAIAIKHPQLWWPNGYGEQPLYQVEVLLKAGSDLLDSSRFSIGLRTLTVKREPDQWGESFVLEVNGVPLFAMGANYIPEDSLLPRRSPERTERLIRDCAAAHFNCIRVWGGGFYPEDYFYDLCDRYGLIVWQDLMFACAVYVMTGEFSENIQAEVADNIKRIRHHACLGLWCGNNEMELAWSEWGLPRAGKLRTDYLKQFEMLLPELAREYDPNTFYWPASPSSGGHFEDPNHENRGDVHYWEVWHGLKPFTDYRRYHFRFVSEFGFQSFPCLETVQSFTTPEDRNIFSRVMELHQKNQGANGKILHYLSENFKYPKDFDSLLYASQILQAEAIRNGVEHWRRNRGRCMGAIYWQINDCWPVASWSSIDYFGRWKALQYAATRFFAPLLLSAREEGTAVELHITNDSLRTVAGEIFWRLRDNESNLIKAGVAAAEIGPLTASLHQELDFSESLRDPATRRRMYLEFGLRIGDQIVSSGTVLFVKDKHFEFLDPRLRLAVTETEEWFEITVTSGAFARFVELRPGIDCRLSDNYFDLSAGESKRVYLEKSQLARPVALDDLEARLSVRSLFDIA